MTLRLTNRKFAKEDEKFLQACSDASVEATVRQASKYRNKKGKVYKELRGTAT